MMWEALGTISVVVVFAGYFAFERWCEYKERTARKR